MTDADVAAELAAVLAEIVYRDGLESPAMAAVRRSRAKELLEELFPEVARAEQAWVDERKTP